MWSKDPDVKTIAVSAPGNCSQWICLVRETSPFPEAKCFSGVQSNILRRFAIISFRYNTFMAEACFSIFQENRRPKLSQEVEAEAGRSLEFRVSLVNGVSSSMAKATQRNQILP